MSNFKVPQGWRWQPPKETIDAIANVLGSHWRAAKSRPLQLFWPRPESWSHPLTTLRSEASSSDTLPDPRPC